MATKIYLKKEQLLFVAMQTDEGAEAAIAGTDSIMVFDVSAKPLNGQTEKLDNITGKSGYQGSLRHGDHSEITFKIYMRNLGSGSLGVSPAYARTFLMCAMAITENAGVDVVVTPVEPSESKFGTLHYYIGDQLHKFVDCKGECKKVYAKVPYYEFKVLGTYNKPVVNNPPATTYESLNKPVAVDSKNTTIQIYGQTIGVKTLTIDYGRRVKYHEDTNQPYIIQTANDGSISIDFTDSGLATNNFWDIAHTGSEGAVAIQHGTEAGRIHEDSIPVIDTSGIDRNVPNDTPAELKVTCGIVDDNWSFLMR